MERKREMEEEGRKEGLRGGTEIGMGGSGSQASKMWGLEEST